MKKPKYAIKKSMKTDVSLQIAPMASIFTVILVFLLKNFSSGTSAIVPNENVVLPELKVADDFQDSLKIEVAQTEILVDDQPIAKLNNFEFDRIEVAENGGLKSVNQAIVSEKEKAMEAQIEYKDVLILADKRAPYRTLKRVIASASSGGYQKVKLVVIKEP
jgi:biopolymer transport protein ExbD